MTSRSPRRRRAIGASIATAAVGLAGLAVATPAHATADFGLERLAGDDRIHTAADIATDTYAAGATHALVARADAFPDALAGNYLAGAEAGPILLSNTDDVPELTLAALEELGVTEVTLLGGTAALGDAVQTELTGAGYTVGRSAGEDRYETAAAIATGQDAAAIGETGDGRTALLATGEGFADALTGGPLSYASTLPLLLTPSDALGEDASAALEELEIEHVLILGGTAAVAPQVELQLTTMGMTSERLAGDTRYDTATTIAEFATTNLEFTDTTVNVATGVDFPDALTGASHAGEESAPVLLANEGNTNEACAYLNTIADTVADGHVFGGTSAVTDEVVANLQECGGAVHPDSNQTFSVADGRGDVTQPTGSQRSFAFADIASAEVQLALVECAQVTETDGVVTFAATDGAADLGTVAAAILTVNSLPALPPGQQTTGTVTDGAVELTVQGSNTEECVITLAFADADDDGALAVDGTGVPTEDFAISGSTTFAAADDAGEPTLPGLDAAPLG